MSAKMFFACALLLISACTATSLGAQTVNDEQEIQAFTRRFMAAYNAQDHAAIGKMYTDDAVRVDQEGKEIKGAANIAAYFAVRNVGRVSNPSDVKNDRKKLVKKSPNPLTSLPLAAMKC